MFNRAESPAVLCLGPPSIQRGDEAFVAKGGFFPLILYPTLDEECPPEDEDTESGSFQYSLVGECYIHGIMYGEFVKDLNTTSTTTTTTPLVIKIV